MGCFPCFKNKHSYRAWQYKTKNAWNEGNHRKGCGLTIATADTKPIFDNGAIPVIFIRGLFGCPWRRIFTDKVPGHILTQNKFEQSNCSKITMHTRPKLWIPAYCNFTVNFDNIAPSNRKQA